MSFTELLNITVLNLIPGPGRRDGETGTGEQVIQGSTEMLIKKFIVRLRMWYADVRGHHGKRWNYEPGDWYMGRHRKRK